MAWIAAWVRCGDVPPGAWSWPGVTRRTSAAASASSPATNGAVTTTSTPGPPVSGPAGGPEGSRSEAVAPRSESRR
jgi:hypothetical protein